MIRLLESTSVVVVDVTQMTDSLQWEINLVTAVFPLHRVLFVGELGPTFHEAMKQSAYIVYEHGFTMSDMNILMYPSRRYFVARVWQLWPFKFERLLYRNMRRIEIQALANARYEGDA